MLKVVVMDRHVALWTSTKVSTETSTTGNSVFRRVPTDRAVKGGEAEAPTCRRRPLRARMAPDTMELAGRLQGRPGSALSALEWGFSAPGGA